MRSLIKPCFLLAALLIFSCKSEEHHSYVGSHGMALLQSKNGEWFAYHMALYHRPHDMQILYKVTFTEAFAAQLQGKTLLSILPERFDLSQLIAGHEITLTTDFYLGHFERGGEKLFSTKVHFVEQKYVRKVDPYLHEGEMTSYDVVWLGPDSRVAIHHIQAAPSFDAIVDMSHSESRKKKGKCQRPKTPATQHAVIESWALTCLGGKPIYSEFKDFQ